MPKLTRTKERGNNEDNIIMEFGQKKEKIGLSVSTENLTWLIEALTNLYANPLHSMIREITSNAIDASVQSGREDAEVTIVLPSINNPQLAIGDTGVGMSIDDIRNVYTKYGSSTKRDDLNAIGSFGLGAKSPFAYTSQFTVESTKNGVTTTGIMSKTSNSFEMSIISVEENGAKDGTIIKIPIDKYDITECIKCIQDNYGVTKDLLDVKINII